MLTYIVSRKMDGVEYGKNEIAGYGANDRSSTTIDESDVPSARRSVDRCCRRGGRKRCFYWSNDCCLVGFDKAVSRLFGCPARKCEGKEQQYRNSQATVHIRLATSKAERSRHAQPTPYVPCVARRYENALDTAIQRNKPRRYKPTGLIGC